MSKIEHCVAPAFNKNIIGTWIGSYKSNPKIKQHVSFLDMGLLEDTDGLLFGNQNESPLSWTAKGDSLKISGIFKDKGSRIYSFASLTNTCDSIVLEVEGVDQIVLKRK
ncbi:hypothetical protein [Dyadobacter sp. CY326]|uniref:hypothetical protein n=1 Tax=Dyadobacter sp. CY326 TaxID=2907300 RepID=UPI001F4870D2|nr:hypothetical protein [Dyadobacter sp. CY326]MCE7068119.1 hypothetical protein [Dyadobacter sp. CY326]